MKIRIQFVKDTLILMAHTMNFYSVKAEEITIHITSNTITAIGSAGVI